MAQKAKTAVKKTTSKKAKEVEKLFIPKTVKVQEDVHKGMGMALLSIPLGILAAILLWSANFIGSLSSFVTAASAVRLYEKGSGSQPIKGAKVLAGMIVLGVLLSFWSMIIFDIWRAYPEVIKGSGSNLSRGSFVFNNAFNIDVIKNYGSDFILFLIFGVIAIYSTIKQLFNNHKYYN